MSTNDKTIKLWKIYEKKSVQVSEMNIEGGRAAGLGASHPDIQELLVRRGEQKKREKRREKERKGEKRVKRLYDTCSIVHSVCVARLTCATGTLRNEMRHRKSVEI